MKTKWRVQITTTVEVEVEADWSNASLEEVINLAHGPVGQLGVQRTDSEVVAVQIDGKWFEAPPF